jgi:hypothetical protein
VHINLAGVSGIGLTTGVTYITIGMTTSNLPCTSPDPQPLFPQFIIIPTSHPNPPIRPNPIMPITFSVQLHFDSAGDLEGADVAVQ